MSVEDIKVPNYNTILRVATVKLIQKYEEYGNTWANEFDSEFWTIRLEDEIKELKDLLKLVDDIRTGSPSFEFKMKNEIADAINILSMIYNNLGKRP